MEIINFIIQYGNSLTVMVLEGIVIAGLIGALVYVTDYFKKELEKRDKYYAGELAKKDALLMEATNTLSSSTKVLDRLIDNVDRLRENQKSFRDDIDSMSKNIVLDIKLQIAEIKEFIRSYKHDHQ